MCWACSCSYKRALAKTKQQDPARHSSVFKKERRPKTDEENRQEKERKREKYMNSKMPKRPDVTKLDHGQDSNNHSGSHHHSSSGPPPAKLAKRERDETDPVGEIAQLKEKIALLEKQMRAKDNAMIAKDQEITQMKAKLFNEEKLIREKMKQQMKQHDDKVAELQRKTRELQSEISRMKKENKPSMKNKSNKDNLFKNEKKFSKSMRTASPVSRSRSRSPVRSRSPSASGSGSVGRDSPAISAIHNTDPLGLNGKNSPGRSPSRSPRPASGSPSSLAANSRSASPAPIPVPAQ